MSSNKKITLIIFSMITILTVIIVVLVAIGSRQTGYEGVKKKAYLTADIVKKSLTSHMVNGNMDQRDVFLNSISQLDNVKDLWVIRAKSVSEQFGKSTLSNENPKDNVDLEVLQTGKEKTVINESFFNANLRVTIPYTASSMDKPNCLSCHNAKEGEVLGAISLSFDIREDRVSNIIVLLYIIGTIAIFLVIILIYIRNKIAPYTSSFDQITDTLKKVVLSEEIASTENRIGFARQAYNDEVMEFNNKASQFPDLIWARLLGFKHLSMLQSTTSEQERTVPQVRF